MRFLFRELFKRLRIRYIILILVILIFLGYISTFSKSTTSMLSNEFPLDKSPNPQATEHFIKAMEYKNYILNLHRFVNYVHISELPDSDAGVVPDTFAMRFSRV